MSVDILRTSWDQCVSVVQYCFTSTETIRLVRTDSPGRPLQLSHSSWTMWCFYTDYWDVDGSLSPHIFLTGGFCTDHGDIDDSLTTVIFNWCFLYWPQRHRWQSDHRYFLTGIFCTDHRKVYDSLTRGIFNWCFLYWPQKSGWRSAESESGLRGRARDATGYFQQTHHGLR